MDKTELLDIFTRQQRIDLTFPDIRREVDGPVIRHISLSDEEGFVIYSHLNEENTDAVIDAQVARFEQIPQDFEWKVYDYDLPGDLIERLHRHGFAIGEPEALLVLDLAAKPAVLTRPLESPLASKVTQQVVRITDPDEVDQIVRLESEVWGENHHSLGMFLKRELQELADNFSIYISYEDGQPAAAAWINFHPGSSFASLWGGATIPRFRNHGHYTRLLAARAQEAWARGFLLLTVDASPMSRPILEKHGFQYLATTTPCKWTVRLSS